MESRWECSTNALSCRKPEDCRECSLYEDCRFCRNRDKEPCSSCKNRERLDELKSRQGGNSAGYDADTEEVLNEHGKYAVRFARNHGMSIAEAYEHLTVKAHKEVLQHLNECRAFAAGEMFIPGA